MNIPADVPDKKIEQFTLNYKAITTGIDRLLLFSADQKIEHLNDNFYGSGIDPADNDPEHIFYIASHSKIGALATQLGLIAHYTKQYPDINYIVKLNSKTHSVKKEQKDPISTLLWSVQDVVQFAKETKTRVCGIGYTIYLGSEFESVMLHEAAQAIYHAHQQGLIAILWMYPRGKAIDNERDGHLIAGAAGVGACLGADFIKLNQPEPSQGKTSNEWLAIAQQAAGKTNIIISGGGKIPVEHLLQQIYDQFHQGKTAGCALGRNLHQRPAHEAIALTHALHAMLKENIDVNKAMEIYKQELE